jgi:hypothetical protein
MPQDPATPRLTDDEVRQVIRSRLRDGLPCNAIALREAVNGGGTERLVRLLKDVRAETQYSEQVMLSHTTLGDTLPKDVEIRMEALRTDILSSISRARHEERAAASAAQQHAAHAAQVRLERVVDEEESAAQNAIALARSLDAALARVQLLEEMNSQLNQRAIDAEVGAREHAAAAQARWDALDTAYQSLLKHVSPSITARKRRAGADGARTTKASK